MVSCELVQAASSPWGQRRLTYRCCSSLGGCGAAVPHVFQPASRAVVPALVVPTGGKCRPRCSAVTGELMARRDGPLVAAQAGRSSSVWPTRADHAQRAVPTWRATSRGVEADRGVPHPPRAAGVIVFRYGEQVFRYGEQAAVVENRLSVGLDHAESRVYHDGCLASERKGNMIRERRLFTALGVAVALAGGAVGTAAMSAQAAPGHRRRVPRRQRPVAASPHGSRRRAMGSPEASATFWSSATRARRSVRWTGSRR
jgi:hypothetical protein